MAQRVGALLVLAAVLAVPLAQRGHDHGAGATGPSRDTCTICAATVHAPALLAAPPAPLVLGRAVVGLAARSASLPRLAPRCWQSPRAPPRGSRPLVA